MMVLVRAGHGAAAAVVALACAPGVLSCRHREREAPRIQVAAIDASGPAAVATCNRKTGLGAPLAPCTPEAPCTSPLGAVTGATARPPRCASGGAADPIVSWRDERSGDERAACVFTPSGASPAAPRPLVVFFHGSRGTADNVYEHTGLRARASSYPLSGDGASPGFVLASLQGRRLHWPAQHVEGAHFDFYFRDLAAPSTNPDVRATDRLIDQLVARGGVDPRRIYLTGWSNGATFAHLYAVARAKTPTPGGHRVAAAAAYAGGDPFRGLVEGESPSCELDPYPRADVPLLEVHRACDALVPCDGAQRAAFKMPPGDDVRDWMEIFTRKIGGPPPEEILLDRAGRDATACAPAAACGAVEGIAAHLDWPKEAEPRVLAFLARHHR